MSKSKNKRVIYDINQLKQKNTIDFRLIDTDSIQFKISGPKDTPYEGGKWEMSIFFPPDYPFKSPSIGFIDKIYHPNVDYNSGSICLDVLNQTWSPIYTSQHIIDIFIPQLLTYPNPDDPLNKEAADMLLNNKAEYDKYVINLVNNSN